MSIRHLTKARRGAAAAALGAALALAVTGCGSGDNKGDEKKPDSGTGQKSSAKGDDGAPQPAADSSKTIGQIRGSGGISIALHSAERDNGGFVTVSGTLTNRGDSPFYAVAWQSKETELKSRSSMSGASLIDARGKKRYLVLRDTDGECLCTTGLSGIKPNESRPVFAQFPAPPKSVTEVDFQIPTMPSVSIKLSG